MSKEYRIESSRLPLSYVGKTVSLFLTVSFLLFGIKLSGIEVKVVSPEEAVILSPALESLDDSVKSTDIIEIRQNGLKDFFFRIILSNPQKAKEAGEMEIGSICLILSNKNYDFVSSIYLNSTPGTTEEKRVFEQVFFNFEKYLEKTQEGVDYFDYNAWLVFGLPVIRAFQKMHGVRYTNQLMIRSQKDESFITNKLYKDSKVETRQTYLTNEIPLMEHDQYIPTGLLFSSPKSLRTEPEKNFESVQRENQIEIHCKNGYSFLFEEAASEILHASIYYQGKLYGQMSFDSKNIRYWFSSVYPRIYPSNADKNDVVLKPIESNVDLSISPFSATMTFDNLGNKAKKLVFTYKEGDKELTQKKFPKIED